MDLKAEVCCGSLTWSAYPSAASSAVAASSVAGPLLATSFPNEDPQGFESHSVADWPSYAQAAAAADAFTRDLSVGRADRRSAVIARCSALHTGKHEPHLVTWATASHTKAPLKARQATVIR